LSIAKASAAWQREKESQVENQEKISETGRRHGTVKKKLTLGSSSSFQELDTFSTKEMNFLIKIYKRRI
jgi:hypothetical protein